MFDSIYIYKKSLRLGRLEVRVSQRAKASYMGRFGGGWNWKLGFQSGGQTILISLLVLELTLTLKKRSDHEPDSGNSK